MRPTRRSLLSMCASEQTVHAAQLAVGAPRAVNSAIVLIENARSVNPTSLASNHS